MSDESAEKYVSYSFRRKGRLTAAVLRAFFRAMLHLRAKKKEKAEISPGEKGMEDLSKSAVKRGDSIQCIPLTKQEMHGFDKIAKRYGVRFSLVREKNDPSHYIFSFPQKDISKIKCAGKDFLKDGKGHGDLEEKIKQAEKEAFTVNQAKTKERGPQVKGKTHKRVKEEPSL